MINTKLYTLTDEDEDIKNAFLRTILSDPNAIDTEDKDKGFDQLEEVFELMDRNPNGYNEETSRLGSIRNSLRDIIYRDDYDGKKGEYFKEYLSKVGIFGNI